jgi:endonuclease YncB( thermonuclease family)
MIPITRFLALLGPLFLAGATDLARAGDVAGTSRIVGGDTLTIAAAKVRLEGIDAPETDQVCLDERCPTN